MAELNVTKFYKVVSASPLGDPFMNSHGKSQQSFWCQIDGVDLPVMITKNEGNTPSLTQGNYGFLAELKHGKKTDYYRFRSAPIPQGMEVPSYAEVKTTVPTRPAVVSDSDIPMWFVPFGAAIKEILTYIREQKAEDAIVAPTSPETATEDFPKDNKIDLKDIPATESNAVETEVKAAPPTLSDEELDDIFGKGE